MWRLLVTHSILLFPLHFSRASPCAITFQTQCTSISPSLRIVCRLVLLQCHRFFLYVDICPGILMPASDRSPYLSCPIRAWIRAVLCHVQPARFPKTVIRAMSTSNPVCHVWWFFHSSTSIDSGSVIGIPVGCSGLVTWHLLYCLLKSLAFISNGTFQECGVPLGYVTCADIMPGSVLVCSFCMNSLKIWTSVAALIVLSVCYKYLVVTAHGAMNLQYV